MFEEFSRGYYLGQFYVEPHAGEYAVIHRTDHKKANEQVYATGTGIERLDNPVVMKLDEKHFPVLGADDIPAQTLAVPEDLLERTRIRDPPALKEVLLAKADRAVQILQWLREPSFGQYGTSGQ